MEHNHKSLETFALLPMFNDYAAAKGLSLSDGSSFPAFFDHLKSEFQDHVENPARVFGLRAETMFAYVAASLSECDLITQEDSGVLFSLTDNVTRPDFRIVTGGDQFLVEVKNFHQANPRKPFTIAPEYVSALRRYAAVMDCRLMVAIYWSRWKMWTMVDIAHFPANGRLYICEALKRNQMAIIGDCMVSTVPPLSLRFTADPIKPRTLDKDGLFNFTIGEVNICANGQVIKDPLEKRLAWFFMFYGRWVQVDYPAEVANGKLEYFEITMNPPRRSGEHPFNNLGFMSQMISRQYLDLTSEGRNVKLLAPDRDPNDLGALIPKDFKGETLKLWRFQVQPNLEDLRETESSKQSDGEASDGASHT